MMPTPFRLASALALTAALPFAGVARAETPTSGRLVLHEAMASEHA